MHSDCMNEIAARVKNMRKEAAAKYYRMGLPDHADYRHPGEMRGYLNVLTLICPNPFED